MIIDHLLDEEDENAAHYRKIHFAFLFVAQVAKLKVAEPEVRPAQIVK